MSNYLSTLTRSERSELCRVIGREWDAVYKLWMYCQSRNMYAVEDFHGYCSELTSVLDDINEADAEAAAKPEIRGNLPCPKCDGYGTVQDMERTGFRPCGSCNGSGYERNGR
jgi:RecJ-like exonuclease